MQYDLELSGKQQEIIETALELLSENGYDALSMRNIASKLNVKNPAIYWHFKNKAVLVDYMAEFILRKGMGDFEPREARQPWQDWLIKHILLLRKAMLAYPDGGRVVAGAHLYPAITLARLMQYSLVSLYSAHVETSMAQCIVRTVIYYTFGYVIEEQADKHGAGSESAKLSDDIASLFRAQDSESTSDDIFVDGLHLIIYGNMQQTP
ncbi:MAG: TetR family transcriptional regulator [Eubacteriaceae bacterium]|nr:TetR family transcriptional regulator [Eubacteriaceae bacterium]